MSAANYHIGVISPEQFIAEHTFAYIIKGVMHIYDGSKNYTLKSGECGIARKNHLARYKKEKENGELEKVFVFFDEKFLRMFQERHKTTALKFKSNETILLISKNNLMPNFIQSLLPYYDHGKINEAFADLKREELLIILLQAQPGLAGLFFDYGIPEKVNIEEFMNRNFKFNVSIERYAFMTGRSLSAFKRDFKTTFKDTKSLVGKKAIAGSTFFDRKEKQKAI